MTDFVIVDGETRSEIPLESLGANAYFAHRSTDCLMLSYIPVVNGHVYDVITTSRYWPQFYPTEFTCPPSLRTMIESGAHIYAHNASFEFGLFSKVLGPRYDWPVPAPEQMRCTMAMCAAMGLPLALDDVAQALELNYQKIPEDHQNMLRMCKPRRPRKGEDPKAIHWFNERHRFEALKNRCEQDVRQELELLDHLRPLTDYQLESWRIDQVINKRGLYVDTTLTDTAADMIVRVTRELNREIKELTGGAVVQCTEVAKIKDWLAGQGIYPENLSADSLSTLLSQDLSPLVHRVLQLRLEGSKISTRKINSFRRGVEKDGRTRDWAVWHGTAPGRWSSRRIQLHNIKRPTLQKSEVPLAIDVVKRGDLALCRMLYGDPMELVSNILRGCIIAGPGNHLIASDYSNIQGRLCAWYSGQQDKLDAFARYDTGTGEDLYNLAYAQVFAIPASEVTDKQRSVGKCIELALGFEGGPAAFDSMARNFGVNIEDQYDHIVGTLGFQAGQHSGNCWEETVHAWHSYGHKSGMAWAKWAAAEMIKRVWRRTNSHIAATWKDLKQSAIKAVEVPTSTQWCCGGRIAYRMHGGHLACRLPSGRINWYLFPELRSQQLPWATMMQPATDVSLTYMRKNPMTKQWQRTYTHGGKQMENICLGAESDLLREAIERCETAKALGYSTDYPVHLHVHDELVSELPIGTGSLAELNHIVVNVKPWIAGCPIASGGWDGKEYRKG